VLGEKGLKAIAFRGMGLFEVNDPDGFVGLCAKLIKEWKERFRKVPQGLTGLYGLMGREDLGNWLSPLVHSHRASFNTPFATSTFVFTDEDPGLKKESSLDAPGILLTNYLSPMLLHEKGLEAKEAALLIRQAARLGLEPVAIIRAGILSPSDLADWEKASNRIPEIRQFEEGTFSTYLPTGPFKTGKEWDREEYAAWCKKRVAIAFCLGLDPIFMLLSDLLEDEVILRLVELGTGLGLDDAAIDKAVLNLLS
jgi:aldehyde:ferredoxin oxidoreductase